MIIMIIGYIGGNMMMKKCCSVHGMHALKIAVGITMLTLLLAGSANATNLTVCPSGCVYSSIQKAINASSSGDTIQVQSGTYFENVKANKMLTLRGIGNPVVDARGSGSAIMLSANGIIIEGFTATGSASYLNAGIKVISNNNTLSGNNASNNNCGIWLYYSSNNTLSGNNASNNNYGIWLYYSSNNTLSGNNVLNNSNGIFLDSNWNLLGSNNNTLIGNNASNNNNGFFLRGKNNIVSGNNVSSNSNCGISLRGLNNMLSGNNASSNNNCGFDLVSSRNNMLSDNNVLNNNKGIFLSESSNNNTLRGNNASNNSKGIYLIGGDNNTLRSNNASNNVIGISLSYVSNNNLLSGNKVLNNNVGIYLGPSPKSHSYNNMLSGNNVSFNKYGIILESLSSSNTMTGNTINSNREYGISVGESSNNKIFHNNFRNNTNQDVYSNANIWHSDYPTGGNYWSDYTGVDFKIGLNQDQPGSDGIGDTPYPIPGGSSVDRYPLLIPFSVGMKGDLNNNGESADAGDLVLMKRASIGEIPADSSYDLNNNGIPADEEDFIQMERASIGEINL